MSSSCLGCGLNPRAVKSSLWGQPLRQRKGQQEPTQAHVKMPAVSALRLVELGCIEAAGGQLRITGKGLAALGVGNRSAA